MWSPGRTSLEKSRRWTVLCSSVGWPRRDHDRGRRSPVLEGARVWGEVVGPQWWGLAEDSCHGRGWSYEEEISETAQQEDGTLLPRNTNTNTFLTHKQCAKIYNNTVFNLGWLIIATSCVFLLCVFFFFCLFYDILFLALPSCGLFLCLVLFSSLALFNLAEQSEIMIMKCQW